MGCPNAIYHGPTGLGQYDIICHLEYRTGGVGIDGDEGGKVQSAVDPHEMYILLATSKQHAILDGQ